GVEAVEVRYKDSSGALNDMASGRVDYGMHDPVFSLAQQREGRLRILAHSSGQRLGAIPDIPTMAESGVPGMDLTSWWAVMLPSATPRPAIDRINAWFNQILAMDDTREFLNKFGGDPFVSTPDAAQALLIKEEAVWGEYVRIAKIDPQAWGVSCRAHVASPGSSSGLRWPPRSRCLRRPPKPIQARTSP